MQSNQSVLYGFNAPTWAAVMNIKSTVVTINISNKPPPPLPRPALFLKDI